MKKSLASGNVGDRECRSPMSHSDLAQLYPATIRESADLRRRASEALGIALGILLPVRLDVDIASAALAAAQPFLELRQGQCAEHGAQRRMLRADQLERKADAVPAGLVAARSPGRNECLRTRVGRRSCPACDQSSAERLANKFHGFSTPVVAWFCRLVPANAGCRRFRICQKPLFLRGKHGGRTRDRTLDLSRVKARPIIEIA